MISLFTSADEELKTGSAQLFFIIAKQNADRFINMTGYGNGAGLLYDVGKKIQTNNMRRWVQLIFVGLILVV